MPYNGMAAYIEDFVAGRRQTKLDAFDKEMAKRLAGAAESERALLHRELLQQRRELELRYTTSNWLDKAAKDAEKVGFVSHPAKYHHGNSKGSSFAGMSVSFEGYLSSSTLSDPAMDMVAESSAYQYFFGLLKTEIAGDSLLACLQRGDTGPFADMAENEQQLAAWIAGFSRALTTKQPTSHKLAKQIYFPVGEGYHLLSPLFASSLAQDMYTKMAALRFGEESKAARQARKNGEWHPQPLVSFPDAAVINFGGANPQNISALNSQRGGRVWLLPSAPSLWQRQEKPPLGIKNLFGRGQLESRTHEARKQLIQLLTRSGEVKNRQIRAARDGYIDEIIDQVFYLVADIQRLGRDRDEWQCWTQKEQCELKPHQRLWLDPWRAKYDETFRQERDQDQWQEPVSTDFALWLNGHLRRAGLSVERTEQREWQTRPLFRRRLHEMEQAIRRYRE